MLDFLSSQRVLVKFPNDSVRFSQYCHTFISYVLPKFILYSTVEVGKYPHVINTKMNKFMQTPLLTKLKPQNILRVRYTSLRLQSTTSLFYFIFWGQFFPQWQKLVCFGHQISRKIHPSKLCSLILHIWHTLNWIISFLKSWHGIISFMYFYTHHNYPFLAKEGAMAWNFHLRNLLFLRVFLIIGSNQIHQGHVWKEG